MRLLAAALALALLACSPPAEDGTRLRVALLPRLTSAPGLTAIESGRLQSSLPETQVELSAFEFGNAVVEAMFAREVDVAYLGPNPALNGFVRSGGKDVVILAGAAQGGAALVVRGAAGITTATDLRGKRLATPQIASTQDIALRRYLRKHGLRSTLDGGDVTVLPLSTPIILSLFARGEIDGAWVSEPLASQLEALPGTQRFVDEADEWPSGRYLATVVAVRSSYLQAHPDVVDRFVAAHVAEVRHIEADRPGALATARAAMTRINGRKLPDAIAKRAWARLRFDVDPLEPALASAAAAARAEGFLPPDAALDGVVERAPLTRALAATSGSGP